MIVHGYYQRTVFISIFQIKIRLLRVRYTSCNKTHVTLIKFMIPFSLLTGEVIHAFINNINSISSSHSFLNTNLIHICIFKCVF